MKGIQMKEEVAAHSDAGLRPAVIERMAGLLGKGLRNLANVIDPGGSTGAMKVNEDELHRMVLQREYDKWSAFAIENGADLIEAHEFGLVMSGCLAAMLNRKRRAEGRTELSTPIVDPEHDHDGVGEDGQEEGAGGEEQGDGLDFRTFSLASSNHDWKEKPE